MIEYLTTNNFNSYSVPLASKIGVLESIYINTIINIYGLNVTMNYTHIDRKLIYNKSAISINAQYNLDIKLSSINIIYISASDIDCIGIYDKTISDIMTNASITNTGTYSNNANDVNYTPISSPSNNNSYNSNNSNYNSNNDSKKEFILAAVKNHIKTKDKEIRSLYEKWLDIVQKNTGIVSKNFLASAENKIDDYTDGDRNMIKEILSIAVEGEVAKLDIVFSVYESRHKELSSGEKINPNKIY